MIKEAAIGIGVALAGFLVWKGVNILPFIFIGGLFFFLFYMADMRSGSSRFVAAGNFSKDISNPVSFDDIGGQETAKKELLEALDFIRFPEKVLSMGIRPLKGVMLLGPPGTGKTLLAKAAAYYTDSIFLAKSGSSFIEMYAGVGAQRVRKLFDNARSLARKKKKKSAVIFIDEIDILGGKRGSHTGHLEYDQTLNQLLVEMDGLDLKDKVHILVMGATNRPDALDKALIRPGRFDRIVQVDLPDLEGRMQILKLHTANKPLDKDVDLMRIAKETFGFSGAHLESLANEAAILAMRENRKTIKQHHFIDAVDKVIMGEKLNRRPDKDELERVAVHESGHALISEINRPGSVSAVTITPRGKALGYMRQMPDKDSYLYTKEYLQDQIAITLAGSAAEQLILGSRSTGAANDFEQSLEITKKIINAGLSSLGIVNEKDVPRDLLHQEMQAIIKEQEERVINMLEQNRDVLEKMKLYLLEKEKVDGEYLRACLREKEKAV